MESKLSAILKERGISKNKFSQLTGLSHHTISNYCSNNIQRIDLNVVRKITDALQLENLNDLFDFTVGEDERIIS